MSDRVTGQTGPMQPSIRVLLILGGGPAALDCYSYIPRAVNTLPSFLSVLTSGTYLDVYVNLLVRPAFVVFDVSPKEDINRRRDRTVELVQIIALFGYLPSQ